MMWRRWAIQKYTGGMDAAGHPDLTDDNDWSDVDTRDFRLLTRNSREFFRAQQVQSNITHVVETRYDSISAAITPAQRLRDGSRILEIAAAFDPDDSEHWIRLHLVERT